MDKPDKTVRSDRRDGNLVRDSDPLHLFMPFLLGNRADNEAVFSDYFDLTNIKSYIEKKNENAEFKYTYFHFVVAALAKTIYFRPKINRFYLGNRLYDRNNISFSFVVKNQMSDNGEESLLIVEAEDNDSSLLDQIHDKICREAYKLKNENQVDGTTAHLGWLTRIPGFILKFVVRILFWLQTHDLLPASLNDFDPYKTSVFISNLGSIKMKAQYHHLVNWSTNSIFVLANRSEWVPEFKPDGSYQMKEKMEIGFTVDERISDGFYFVRSVELFRRFIENPELLDKPISSEIDYN